MKLSSSSPATQKNTSKTLGAALLLALAALPALACGSPPGAEDTASDTQAFTIPPPHTYYTCEPTNQCLDSNNVDDAGVGDPTLCASIPGCSWDNCFSHCSFDSSFAECQPELG